MEQHIAHEGSSWRHSKALAWTEVIVAIAVIVGHNIFRIGPGIPLLNEVPLLFLLGWLLLRLRGEGWRSVGLTRPVSWRRTLAIAAVASVVMPTLRTAIEYLTTLVVPEPEAESIVGDVAGNWLLFGVLLLVVWTFAAFGEEMVYRAYLMSRIADLGNQTRLAWGISLVTSSMLFGVGHYYQGIGGVCGSTMSGLILGSLYLYVGRRNLWISILTHGLADTIILLLLFFGLVV